MRQANLFMMSAAMLLAACGGTKDAGKTDQVLIEKSDIKIEGKRMTPEALWAMGRIGGLAVSQYRLTERKLRIRWPITAYRRTRVTAKFS